jgi:hypothetical protein
MCQNFLKKFKKKKKKKTISLLKLSIKLLSHDWAFTI